MRKILWLPLLTAVCGFASLRADVTIVVHIDGMGPAIDRTEMIKAGRTRVDYPGGISTIRDIKTGEMIRLLRAKKSYFKSPSKQPSRTPKSGGFTLTPTGKKDTISGYSVDEYTGNTATGRTKVTMWLTNAMPDYGNILKELAGTTSMAAELGLDTAALPGFPMRSSYEFRGGQTYTNTVVSISTEPIADSEFDIPADYEPMQKPAGSP